VRDKPKGKVLLKLNNGVRVDVQKKRGEWYWISMRAVVDEGAFTNKGGIRKGTALHMEGGGEMGKVVADVDEKWLSKVFGVIEDRTLEVRAWTHKVNIKESAEDGIITDEEREWLAKIGGGFNSSNDFRIMSDARKFLRIMLKGSPNTIKWYIENRDTETSRYSQYGTDIWAAVGRINPEMDIEGYSLIMRVLKEAKEYPDALKAAIIQVGHAKDTSAIPILKGFINHPDRSLRLQLGKSLLDLEDIDSALPILDKAAEEWATSALGHIFHNMIGTEWEKRGIEHIRKALKYEHGESRALAAMFMIGLSDKGYIKDSKEEYWNILIKIAEEILSKKEWVSSSYGYSDRRALNTVLTVFSEHGDKSAIPLIRRIAEHPEIGYLRNNAKKLLERLERN
jgi:hypothetical protein